MQYGALSASLFAVALVLTYGEGQGRPLRLSMASIQQAQNTGDILKASKEREKVIQRQLKIADEVDSSSAVGERRFLHQEDAAGHAAQVISDMQQMMGEEHKLRMAAQAHASQMQETLKSATGDEERMSSDLVDVQEDLSQRAQQLAKETTALDRSHIDKENLDKKLDAWKSADAQKTITINQDVKRITAKTIEEKTNIGLLQQKLDERKLEQERHEKIEKEDKAHIDDLTSKSDSLLVNVDDLKEEISMQKKAANKSEISIAIERKVAQQAKEALAKAKLRISPLEVDEKKVKALTDANTKLESKYEQQIAESIHARGIEHQEEKLVESTQDSLKEARHKLEKVTEDKNQEDVDLHQLSLELQGQKAELQSQARMMKTMQDSLSNAEAENSAMKKKVDQTAVAAHKLNDEGKQLRAKVTELKKVSRGQGLKLKTTHSRWMSQVEAESQKDAEQRAAAEKSEAALKKQAAVARAQLDAATQTNKQILADAENFKREAHEKRLKLQAAVVEATKKAASEESRLNSIVFGKTAQINAIKADADKESVKLKEASEEKAKLAESSDSRAKVLAQTTKELQASKLADAQLVQKLKKVSVALVKEHKQRLEDWKVFKTKLETP